MLEGKLALITGGGRGIGRAITLALAGAGADVVITYFRHEKAAEETAAEVQALGRKALVVSANLAYDEEIDRLFCQIEQQFGCLDIFVNNAASTTFKPLLELQPRHWDYVMNVNLRAFFRCSVQAVKLMAGREGRIVAISSMGSRKCVRGYAALGVAKAATETLVRYMAVEWGAKGINTNAICAGPVDTAALDSYSTTMPEPEKFKALLSELTPEKRIGRPEDLTGLVLFLCSSAADWIRGQTIVIDGGFSLV